MHTHSMPVGVESVVVVELLFAAVSWCSLASVHPPSSHTMGHHHLCLHHTVMVWTWKKESALVVRMTYVAKYGWLANVREYYWWLLSGGLQHTYVTS